MVCQLKVLLARQLVVHPFDQLHDLQNKKASGTKKVQQLHIKHWHSPFAENAVRKSQTFISVVLIWFWSSKHMLNI